MRQLGRPGILLAQRALSYTPRQREVRFLLDHVIGFESFNQSAGEKHVPKDVLQALLDEGARLSSASLAPCYLSSDTGCTFDEGKVKTPDGFRRSFEHLAEGGWVC